MNSATRIKGGWEMSRVERVLANAAARAMMQGKAQPVTETVLARLAAAR
jgi:hypothetical protein